MSRIKDVSEIIKISESHDTPNNLACKYLREKVDVLIRGRAKNHRDCVFQVPMLIVSNPHYDRSKVTKRIASHYEKIGFTCELEDEDEFSIIISWSKDDKNYDHEYDSNENDDDDSEKSTSSEDDEEPAPASRKIVINKPTISLQSRVNQLKNK